MSNKISTLSNSSLCFQCGTCAAACKPGYIVMEADLKKGMLLPKVDNLRCTNCGLCEKVCPILNIMGPKDQFKALSTGIYHATDASLFATSSSGGTTGAILKYLFDNNKINCAVVTGIRGISAEPRIIRSADEILEIQGSKYQPVALNAILREIRKTDRFAFVGLPCHIQGLRRLTDSERDLGACFVLAIGIYCTIGRSFLGTNAALGRSLKMTGNLCYRYGDFPGAMGFISNDRFTSLLSYHHFLEQYDYLFYPKGCHYCDDLFNVNADISIGDAWGLECGKSGIVMSRTDIGKETIVNAEKCNALHKVRDASWQENYSTQRHSYDYKISSYYSRIKTLRIFTHATLKKVLPYDDNQSFSPSYFLLFILGFMLNSSLGFRMVTNDLQRKILIKFRNRLLNKISNIK